MSICRRLIFAVVLFESITTPLSSGKTTAIPPSLSSLSLSVSGWG